MNSIEVLDSQTINKIAAGEVVERPASVVKELVENSVDSKATAITVEIKEGGISFIRVTDNGSGIAKNEIKKAFYRHATSKIRTEEDLITIASLGFRGEALSSIASVAQIELITKEKESLTGVRYCIEGGMEKSIEEIGCPDGTTFLVRNLFYNTPARKKFLKTPQTEGSYIGDWMNHVALSHPEISFQFIVNGQTKLFTNGNGNLLDVIYQIYGKEIASNIIPIEKSMQDIKVTGFIGKPHICRGNRTYETYFLNHRYIKSKVVTAAVEEAYKSFVTLHKYPFLVINIQMLPANVDVNVHPTKMEVRFKKEDEIYSFLVEEIKKALLQKELIPNVTLGKETRKNQDENPIKKASMEKFPEPFEVKRKKELEDVSSLEVISAPEPKKVLEVKETATYGNHETKEIASNISSSVSKEEVKAFQNTSPSSKQEQEPVKDISLPFKEAKQEAEEPKKVSKEPDQTFITEQMTLFDGKLLSEEAKPKHRLIGQLFATYWLIEYEDKFFMMDQHAAHEKVMFEKFMAQFKNKEFLQQRLEPPMVISLTPKEIDIINRYLDTFYQLGFIVEEFGGNEYVVRAVPSNMYQLNDKQLFLALLDSLVEDTGKNTPDLVFYKIATMACKAAVKGNQKLSFAEANQLVEDLLKLENPYTCPHGRPTIVSMTKSDIERKFKRII
ncbi:MAG: DNA mismatch repair endonuclease MutL [Lachnospiraceae bacterium]|nr:DNA mismatch repair endonuclease MutL [Lachnospiraceae bacterium]